MLFVMQIKMLKKTFVRLPTWFAQIIYLHEVRRVWSFDTNRQRKQYLLVFITFLSFVGNTHFFIM